MLQHNYNNSKCVFVCNINSNGILSNDIVSKLSQIGKNINDDTFREIVIFYISIFDTMKISENEQYCDSFYTKIKNLTNNNV